MAALWAEKRLVLTHRLIHRVLASRIDLTALRREPGLSTQFPLAA